MKISYLPEISQTLIDIVIELQFPDGLQQIRLPNLLCRDLPRPISSHVPENSCDNLESLNFLHPGWRRKGNKNRHLYDR